MPENQSAEFVPSDLRFLSWDVKTEQESNWTAAGRSLGARELMRLSIEPEGGQLAKQRHKMQTNEDAYTSMNLMILI